MNDSGNTPRNQAQIDSRENLFYFLQTVSDQAGAESSHSREASPVANEQVETHVARSEIVL
jgi:hypothetical protein